MGCDLRLNSGTPKNAATAVGKRPSQRYGRLASCVSGFGNAAQGGWIKTSGGLVTSARLNMPKSVEPYLDPMMRVSHAMPCHVMSWHAMLSP